MNASPPPTLLLTNARIATLGRDGLLEPGALRVEGDRIAWVGPAADAPGDGARVADCGGRLLTPGLVDCHTHLVFGGDRSDEFEQRLEGATYREIAEAGGGIVATVRATRAADAGELRASALNRLDDLLADGVTTVEIKSGYGLDVDTEVRCLEVARSLEEERPVSVRTTYLGAHAVPPEHRDDRDRYLQVVTEEALPVVAERHLADAVDGFCESIAFSVEEIDRVFTRARALGLPVKLHAEQLSNLGGAKLAAQHGALSADHLEYLDDEGVVAMARAGTVAVLLPGAFYYLRESRLPPVSSLRAADVPMAVATDLNPGSSPVRSLLTTMNMACVLFGLTPAEALAGATVHAARALGLEDRGRIAPGLRADLALWDVDSPAQLCHPLGARPLYAVLRGGELVRGALP